jgi:hypothetical protein
MFRLHFVPLLRATASRAGNMTTCLRRVVPYGSFTALHYLFRSIIFTPASFSNEVKNLAGDFFYLIKNAFYSALAITRFFAAL